MVVVAVLLEEGLSDGTVFEPGEDGIREDDLGDEEGGEGGREDEDKLVEGVGTDEDEMFDGGVVGEMDDEGDGEGVEEKRVVEGKVDEGGKDGDEDEDGILEGAKVRGAESVRKQSLIA